MQKQLTRDDIFKLAYEATIEIVNSTPGFRGELSFKKTCHPSEPDLYEPVNDVSEKLLVITTSAAHLHGIMTLSDQDIGSIAEEVYVRTIIDLGLTNNTVHLPNHLSTDPQHLEVH